MLLLFLISLKWTLTLKICLTSLHKFQALRVGLISMSSLLFVMLGCNRVLHHNAALIVTTKMYVHTHGTAGQASVTG